MFTEGYYICKRIDQIKEEYPSEFSHKSARWGVKFNEIPLTEVRYDLLNPAELVQFFELVLRRYYKFM